MHKARAGRAAIGCGACLCLVGLVAFVLTSAAVMLPTLRDLEPPIAVALPLNLTSGDAVARGNISTAEPARGDNDLGLVYYVLVGTDYDAFEYRVALAPNDAEFAVFCEWGALPDCPPGNAGSHQECSFSECSGEHPYIGVLQQGIADEYELQVRAVMREQRCTDSLLVEMMLLFSSSAVLMWSCLGLICCSATCGLPAMIVGFLFIRAAEQVEYSHPEIELDELAL